MVFAVLLLCILGMALPAGAAEQTGAPAKGKILFVPHDNRPISDARTAEVVRRLGYEVIVPPRELLDTGPDKRGDAEALWQWTKKNAQGVQAAVVSSDSLLYGGLISSRKYDYQKNDVQARVPHLEELRKDHPDLRLYVFGSIMRTPKSGVNAGTQEPDYYMEYGADIFRYTGLCDKEDQTGLSRAEKEEQAALKAKIPAPALQDWFERRAKNFAANEKLIDFTREGSFDYFILGRDDNAPLSQTHMESRKLAAYSAALPASKFQIMTGIDEMGLLLLTRAVNDLRANVPFVYVTYNKGMGGQTIPSYSDEPIARSLAAEIKAVGGIQVAEPQKAELVLAVNTNPDGRTMEANEAENNGVPRAGTQSFVDMVAGYVQAGCAVGVADIAFANGADNAMMQRLKDNDLLFKLRSYAGYNTATNSTGFALGQGILAAQMDDDEADRLLLNRYLDDWGYQGNVRTTLIVQLDWLRERGISADMGSRRQGAEVRTTRLMREFAENNLPPFACLQGLRAEFPVSRGFDVNILLGDE